MKNCIACGTPLEDGSKFCYKCGANQEQQPVNNTQNDIQPMNNIQYYQQPMYNEHYAGQPMYNVQYNQQPMYNAQYNQQSVYNRPKKSHKKVPVWIWIVSGILAACIITILVYLFGIDGSLSPESAVEKEVQSVINIESLDGNYYTYKINSINDASAEELEIVKNAIQKHDIKKLKVADVTLTDRYDEESLTVYVYMDNLKWQVVPSAMMTYIEKSNKSNDISAAKSIKTAVETAMSNEDYYELLTSGSYGSMVYVTIIPDMPTSSDSAVSITDYNTSSDYYYSNLSPTQLAEEAKEEIGRNIGENTPSLNYKSAADSSIGAPVCYVAAINNYGTVKVFASTVETGFYCYDDGYSDYGYQLVPEIDWHYQY